MTKKTPLQLKETEIKKEMNSLQRKIDTARRKVEKGEQENKSEKYIYHWTLRKINHILELEKLRQKIRFLWELMES